MPRMKAIYSDFFWKPLTEDVEELLARFQHTDSVRFEHFSAIWREMGFSDVFRGIFGLTEMKRFCRVALTTAVKYFLPPHSYQIQVGGLYLMYAFYHTQLSIPPMKIRLALKDWAYVQKFLRDSIHAQHYDVVYILQKLFATRAIHYTAMPHFLSFQKLRKKESTESVCTAFLGRNSTVQELLSSEFLEELANIESHYQGMKKTMVEKNDNINIAHPDFSQRLYSCAGEFTSWQEKTFSNVKREADKCSGDEEKPMEAESRARLLSSIKNKSYSCYQEMSKSRRHRQVETVDSCTSEAEQSQETAASRRRRPLSLRARTWKKLSVPEDKSQIQAWLLSCPEHEKVPLKRTDQPAPIKW
ncbi:snRNA-activating protein complex subunit 1-like [Myripristis murdjan]|uniref:snRNA-activating protein complex subunit 1-like n=1 Tax=Myripristis murdjan TaxID=586833 RepID=A0A667XC77_9TELE|nr:snRNA-activating protein complex subunit 1-like [Myripristis murdjan]